MKFRIWTILWVFALFASGMALFSEDLYLGISVPSVVLIIWSSALGMQKTHAPGQRLANLLATTAITGTVIGLLLPATGGPGVRTAACRHNLSSIAKAVLAYHSKNDFLPPNTTKGNDGESLHSWRSLLVPYLEQSETTYRYDHSKTWDYPSNRMQLNANGAPLYCCPHDVSGLLGRNETASYFAVTGPNTAWSIMGSKENLLADKTDQTILLIEQTGSKIIWCEPKDFNFDEALALLTTPPGLSPESNHPAMSNYGFFYNSAPCKLGPGFHIAFADGSVKFIAPPLEGHFARALLTANGGENISEADYAKLFSPELDYAKIYSLSAFTLLALLPGMNAIRNRGA
jgi:hypothetical protein